MRSEVCLRTPGRDVSDAILAGLRLRGGEWDDRRFAVSVLRSAFLNKI
jgi:hypothetical protein